MQRRRDAPASIRQGFGVHVWARWDATPLSRGVAADVAPGQSGPWTVEELAREAFVRVANRLATPAGAPNHPAGRAWRGGKQVRDRLAHPAVLRWLR